MEDLKKRIEEILPKRDTNNNTYMFKVTIEEHISQTFEVEAADAEEAMEFAEESYNNGEFVLEPGNIAARLMMAENEYDGETTDWIEF